MKKIVTKNVKIKILAFIISLSFTFFLTTCKKDQGSVTIFGIIDTVKNCYSPYVVQLYADFESGSPDVKYFWDFGDGNSTNEPNPIHIYQKMELFQVSVTITDRQKSQTKSVVLDLRSQNLPVLTEFYFKSPSPVLYAPALLSFINSSQHALEFYWNFGDGDYSRKTSPVHEFRSPGNYNVWLEGSCNGDTTKYLQIVRVLPPPSDVYIQDISVWTPSNWGSDDLFCKVKFGIFDEFTTDVRNNSSLPVTWTPRQDIFFFHYFDNSVLRFEIYGNDSQSNYIYTFETTMNSIANDHYPEILTWDSGTGFKAEILLKYQ